MLAGDFPQIAALDVLCITATRSVLLYAGFWGADQARCWVKVPLVGLSAPARWRLRAWRPTAPLPEDCTALDAYDALVRGVPGIQAWTG